MRGLTNGGMNRGVPRGPRGPEECAGDLKRLHFYSIVLANCGSQGGKTNSNFWFDPFIEFLVSEPFAFGTTFLVTVFFSSA